jgi:hypothetical protein
VAKIGRNDDCPCGSGRKYKKCCLERDKAPKLPAVRDQQGSLIHRAPVETIHQGKRVRAVGSAVAFSPLKQTDHEHYVDVLRGELGEEWNQAQLALPEGERHVLHRWNTEWDSLRRGALEPVDRETVGDGQYSSVATGDLNCLINLAYDVFTIADSMVLPEELVRKLKTVDQFQGARYELAVAAVFLRSGFEIEWIPREGRKRPEFIATHSATGREVAVEAKSRHRPGVLGRQGEIPEQVKIDVSTLMGKALKKETDGLPFVICVDLNMPAASESLAERAKELEARVLDRFGAGDKQNPDPWAAVIFTNYSWQWDGAGVAGDSLSCVAIPRHSQNPLPHSELDLITQAVSQYGDVTRRPMPNSGAQAA